MQNFYTRIRDRITRDRDIHVISAQHYHRQYVYMTIPVVLLTTMGSIVSFVYSTALVHDDRTRSLLSVSVGVMGIMSTMIQSVQATMAFGVRAKAFESAARQYDLLIVQLTFEIEDPDEVDFIKTIEQRLIDIRAQCEFYPPTRLVTAYDDSR